MPQKSETASIRIAVDVGGTFTDGVAEIADSHLIWAAKALTTPDDPGRAMQTVIEDLLEQIRKYSNDESSPAVVDIVHGTTLVTNTLIERKGSPIALVATAGTEDVLDIRRELRYDLYNLNITFPEPLVRRAWRIGINERTSARGECLRQPDTDDLEQIRLLGAGVKGIAVCLLNACVNDHHERIIAEALAKKFPNIPISISSEVANEIREYERTSTVVANAYVRPTVEKYLDEINGRLAKLQIPAPLRIMVSSGGFTSAQSAARNPIRLLESGPAGGVLSAVNTGWLAGEQHVLAFDMGGTTAKACVAVDREPDITHEFEASRLHRFKRGSGFPILIPSIDLVEIGAGGGSIAKINSLGLLNVGPESAGSVPGPACYGLGGTEATVTDADLVLGYLDPDNFLGGEMKLDVGAAMGALGKIRQKIDMAPAAIAWGICNIVNENMTAVARVHIAEKGLDPRKFTLVATGGAGPLHAVEIARRLGIRRVLCPIASGVGSCLGFLAAPLRADRSRSQICLLGEVDWDGINSLLERDFKNAQREIDEIASRSVRDLVDWTIGIEIRYAGQGNAVEVQMPYRRLSADDKAFVQRLFEERYSKLYGAIVPGGVAEVVTWRLSGRSTPSPCHFNWATAPVSTSSVISASRRKVYLPLRRAYEDVPVYDRYSLAPGTLLEGPLVMQERECTIVVALEAEVRVQETLSIQIDLKGP